MSVFEIPEDVSGDFINSFDGLALMYDGKEVEGEVFINPNVAKEQVMQEVIFSIGSKKYRFWVEEIA